MRKMFGLICGLYKSEIVPSSRYYFVCGVMIHWLIIVQKLDKLLQTYIKQTKHKSKIHIHSVHKNFPSDFKYVTP
jgi:hypothetical protein